jgi:hypothetical protein
MQHSIPISAHSWLNSAAYPAHTAVRVRSTTSADCLFTSASARIPQNGALANHAGSCAELVATVPLAVLIPDVSRCMISWNVAMS